VSKSVNAKHVFCIGIGGIGVSGLAELLHHEGVCVSGSDPTPNALTNRLTSLGVTVFNTHAESNIDDADLIVYSSAVPKTNPERAAAEKKGIPQMTRGQLLADCSKSYCNIFVAGTHGKTTTSGLMSWVFEKADQDPTFVVGGVLRDRDSTMRVGHSRFFIAESDESDASFLLLSPTVAVITNIDQDHMETYEHNFEKLKDSFLQFVSAIPADGFVVACIDNPVVRALLPQITACVITYGESMDADYRLEHFKQAGLKTHFSVNGRHITLNLAGKHNALNALSVIAVSDHYQLSPDAVETALKTFPGMRRRLHARGEMRLDNGTALVFDDYGHHPTEVRVTLQAVTAAFPDQRVILVFQPHRYTRTRDLMQEFVDVLKTAHTLVLTEVYAASESAIEGADGAALFEAVKKAGKTDAIFVPEFAKLPDVLRAIVKPNDIVILQGAGNIVTMASVLTSEK
jgi:UDP-N-acetylmuramate--alanine ligase